jgi:branched-chain amino acid transport system ATP-binding protein
VGVQSESTLQVAALAKAFGGVQAVRDVSFRVDRGELVALIGPNGAGKTTCFNLINGQLSPDTGTVRFCGERIDGLPPRDIAHKGVGRTFQVAATFASMTVRENVEVALIAHARREGRLIEARQSPWRERADALLDRVGVGALATAHSAALAYGDVKRVELALALANAPELLLMDEPTAGMAVAMRGELMRLTADLAHRERLAVLFAEHDMDVVFGFADRVIVLDRGAIIAEGPPAAIQVIRWCKRCISRSLTGLPEGCIGPKHFFGVAAWRRASRCTRSTRAPRAPLRASAKRCAVNYVASRAKPSARSSIKSSGSSSPMWSRSDGPAACQRVTLRERSG